MGERANPSRGHGRLRLAAAAVIAALALVAAGPVPGAAADDAASTAAYVRADLRLVQGAAALLPRSEAALHGVISGISRTCPLAASGSPQNPESTRLSNELIGALVLAAYRPGASLQRRFAAEVSGLRWGSRALTRQVSSYSSSLRTLALLRAPDICGDIRAWAAGGFGAVPAATAAFEPRFMAAWVAVGELPAGLSASASPAVRASEQRARGYEARLADLEARAVEIWGSGMTALDLWP